MIASQYDKLKGCFFGLAVGDALGVPLEFQPRDVFPLVVDMIGGGVFELNPGEWTDDTSMALCLGDSLITNKGFVASDIMNNFIQWVWEGEWSHNGKCFDIGIATRTALHQYLKTHDPFAGSTDPQSSGNGSIMRLAPVPVYYKNDLDDCIHYSILQSKLTHASPACLQISAEMSQMIWELSNNVPLADIINVDYYRGISREYVKSSGYVVHTFDAAKWAICNTNSFETALIKAVNLADDSDTVGAVTGQIAGALYGYNNIPKRWLDVLVWKEQLTIMFEELYKSN
jgi:ADP-ribosyl-[dinitrogen reductase] hydrolase